MANPSRLRHRVTFQKRQEVLDDIGGVNKDEKWVDVFDAWAYIKPLRGREYFEGGAMRSEVSHAICIHYRKDQEVRPEMRVLYENRIFEIQSVINVEERNSDWELMCREVYQTDS